MKCKSYIYREYKTVKNLSTYSYDFWGNRIPPPENYIRPCGGNITIKTSTWGEYDGEIHVDVECTGCRAPSTRYLAKFVYDLSNGNPIEWGLSLHL